MQNDEPSRGLRFPLYVIFQMWNGIFHRTMNTEHLKKRVIAIQIQL